MKYMVVHELPIANRIEIVEKFYKISISSYYDAFNKTPRAVLVKV